MQNRFSTELKATYIQVNSISNFGTSQLIKVRSAKEVRPIPPRSVWASRNTRGSRHDSTVWSPVRRFGSCFFMCQMVILVFDGVWNMVATWDFFGWMIFWVCFSKTNKFTKAPRRDEIWPRSSTQIANLQLLCVHGGGQGGSKIADRGQAGKGLVFLHLFLHCLPFLFSRISRSWMLPERRIWPSFSASRRSDDSVSWPVGVYHLWSLDGWPLRTGLEDWCSRKLPIEIRICLSENLFCVIV